MVKLSVAPAGSDQEPSVVFDKSNQLSDFHRLLGSSRALGFALSRARYERRLERLVGLTRS